MAKITIEELSESLKNYLDGLGLTEAQVQDLIDKMQEEVIGNKAELSTTDKSSLVAAINELFQNANNGKQIIADAIGSPLTEGDTFAAMGNSINSLTTDFRNALALKGVNAPGDKFETLIRRIEEIVQSGNVLNNQVMISGEYVAPEDYIPRGGYDKIITIDLNLDFDPEYFFIYFSNLGNKQDSNLNSYTWTESVILSTDCPEVLLHGAYLSSGYGGSDTRFRLSYDRTTANITLIKGSYGPYAYVKQGDIIKWYAIGSSQLQHNGGGRTITPSTTNQTLPLGYYDGEITVSGDSDLVAGNIKSGVNIFGITGTAPIPSGNATASQVLTGYTFSNGSGVGISGTMANNGAKTFTPSARQQTAPAGYYSSITVNTDSNLVAANIVSGKKIFGVTGTAPSCFTTTPNYTLNYSSSSGANGIYTVTHNLGRVPTDVIVYMTEIKGGSYNFHTATLDYPRYNVNNKKSFEDYNDDGLDAWIANLTTTTIDIQIKSVGYAKASAKIAKVIII